jgi:NADH-quinone oxidoreductase subunit H
MTAFFQSQFNFSAVLAVVLIGIIMGVVAYCIFFERKVAGWVQDRHGPNRVGFFGLFHNFHFWGLGQSMADGLKLLLKEDIIPNHVDKPLFILAPALAFGLSLLGFVVIPWGGQVDIGGKLIDVQVANPDIGLLYILAIGSMGVYGIVLGGWASNNKYSLFGAVRATAQMLSYEIPMGVAILIVVLTCGQVRLEEIVLAQVGDGNVWNIVRHPLAALILLITLFAETNRAPFDLAEAEQELVGGFHTEYSALKFGMFFLGEYAHIITGSAFFCVLFLGGWHLPWFQPADHSLIAGLLKMLCLGAKIVFFIFVFMWIRWTLPRFRFDQLMRVAWKGLIPMTLGLLLVVIVGLYFGWQDNIVYTLGGNVAVLIVSLIVAAISTREITGRQDNLPPIHPSTTSTPGASPAGAR